MPTADSPAHSLIGLVEMAGAVSPAVAYLAIGGMMLLENIFPPLPSELIMPLGGFMVHQGKLEMLPVVASGLVGSVIGATFWYGVGRWIDEPRLEGWLRRHGRWIGLPATLLPRSRRWFERHGVWVVFWGRLIPGIRPFVSLPAGFELMPALTFLLWTSAGTLIWVLALTFCGLALGSAYQQVGFWLGQVSIGLGQLLLIGVALGGGIWMARRRRQRP